MMKHKKRFRTFAVLLAALVCLGGFSMTAYAQTPEETPPDTAVETPAPEEIEQPQKEKSNPAGILLVALLLAGVGGGAFYYFKILKPKQAVKGNTDLEDFDFEDDEETDDE